MFKYDRRKFRREITGLKDWEFAYGQNKHALALAREGAEILFREIMEGMSRGAVFFATGKNRDDLEMTFFLFGELEVHVNLRQEIIEQMDSDPDWDDHDQIVAALEKTIRAVKRRHKRNEA